MTVEDIEKAIEELSFLDKDKLFKHLAEKLEDYIDLKEALEALEEDDFMNYRDYRKIRFKDS